MYNNTLPGILIFTHRKNLISRHFYLHFLPEFEILANKWQGSTIHFILENLRKWIIKLISNLPGSQFKSVSLLFLLWVFLSSCFFGLNLEVPFTSLALNNCMCFNLTLDCLYNFKWVVNSSGNLVDNKFIQSTLFTLKNKNKK